MERGLRGAGRESLLGLTGPWILHPRAQARLSEHGRLLGRGMCSDSACYTPTPTHSDPFPLLLAAAGLWG